MTPNTTHEARPRKFAINTEASALQIYEGYNPKSEQWLDAIRVLFYEDIPQPHRDYPYWSSCFLGEDGPFLGVIAGNSREFFCRYAKNPLIKVHPDDFAKFGLASMHISGATYAVNYTHPFQYDGLALWKKMGFGVTRSVIEVAEMFGESVNRQVEVFMLATSTPETDAILDEALASGRAKYIEWRKTVVERRIAEAAEAISIPTRADFKDNPLNRLDCILL